MHSTPKCVAQDCRKRCPVQTPSGADQLMLLLLQNVDIGSLKNTTTHHTSTRTVEE